MGKIKNFIKFNPGVRMAFRRAGSAMVSFAGLFIPIQPDRILFLSFGARQYSDSPRALYEAMREDPFFQKYEMAWAFEQPEKIPDIGCKKIKADTMQYFVYALSSKIWITNTSICRGLQFKKKKNLCVNTWHGTPLKKMGRMLDPNSRYKERIDIACCQNEMDKRIFLRLFTVKEGDILKCDLPRNDALLRYTPEDIREIRERLGIQKGKKVLLYMPTYREYNLDGENRNFFLPPVDFDKWEAALGDSYVLLIRFHYLIEKMIRIPENGFCINVTYYENLNDLYATADMLISDYSSSYIDYSILERPMFCFAYDFDQYQAERGFELDFEQEIPCRIDRNEDELITHIRTCDTAEATARAKRFHRKYAPYAGHATERMMETIKERLRTE